MDILNQLEDRIIDVLNEITPEINNTLYLLIKSREGFKSVIELVKYKVVMERMNIGEALNIITLEFNNNLG
jgi:hypothetical protein